MRAFIALELPAEIKEILGQIQKKLMSSNADVKWVEPKNLHLTIKFLGEINEQQKENIAAILREVASKNELFQSALTCIGAFPKQAYPRVIWAGLDGRDEPIKNIARLIEEKAAGCGFPKEERSFTSHITLGRVRSGKNRAILVKALEEEQNRLEPLKGQKRLEFDVSKITLFKSNLSPRGPVYEVECEANLKTT